MCVPIGPQYTNGVLGGPIGKHGEIWVEKWEMGFVWPHREAWSDLGTEMGFCVAP